MENLKVNYEQIAEANKEITTMPLGNKNYAPVNERIKAFRKIYPTGTIETFIESQNEDYILIKTEIRDEDGKLIATGRACEKKAQKGINLIRMIENCETSSVGRALGFCGIGVDNSIASAEDMENIEDTKTFQIAKGISISLKDATDQVKLVINDLYKKMGIRMEDLNDVLSERLWTNLSEMNVYQLLKLETELKSANMENSSWHNLYNQNTKAKDVVPMNQQVTYKSSWRRFGEMALNMCGTNELRRQQVINEYLEMEIDLGE